MSRITGIYIELVNVYEDRGDTDMKDNESISRC